MKPRQCTNAKVGVPFQRTWLQKETAPE